jgi:hypothetical protein
MIECTEGHYEVQKVSYGEAYVWCPEHVLVECDCGEKLALIISEAVCECGIDHTSLVKQQLASQRAADAAPHPLEAEYQEWRKKQHEHLFSEKTYWLELSGLD